MHMSNPKSFFFTLVMILAAAGVAPVQASTPDPLAVQLAHCAALTDAGPRLACYDALAGSSASNRTAATTPAASSGPAYSSAAKSTAANSSNPNSGAAASGTTPSGVAASSVSPGQADMQFGVHNGALETKLVNPHREKHMLAVVSAISNRPEGELVVTLDNGQVWTQIEATRYPLKAGDHIEIDVGAMGSYVLWSPANRRATKVTRIS
jgi:hypothetical protein